ncbi:MAG: S8 family peptidase [archaeon]
MKKIILGSLFALAVVIMFIVPVAASDDKIRVAITESNKDKKDKLIETYDYNHDFGGVFTTELTEKEIKKLKDDGYKVEEVGYGELLKDNDESGKGAGKPAPVCNPSTQKPWGITMVNGGSGGKYGGVPVKVAVLDSGANTAHPDLKNNIVMCKDATAKRGLASSCSDTDGHGTHVAGTVAANGKILGVAPEANLMIIKVCKTYCLWDDVAEAIRYAADNGANVISMSLGGSAGSTILKDAVDYAYGKGVLIVVAAGNEGTSGVSYPAYYANTVSVGAIDSSKNTPYWSSVGLNDGDYVREAGEVEMAAPGVSVESTYKDGCYYTMSGTSMATPHVSGLAAKLWQGSATATRTYLQERAKLHDLNVAGDDTKTGFGLPIAP